MKSSVKEIKHTIQSEQKKSGEHVMLQRIKLIAWDWSTTSLWCWYVIISWNGMIMVLVLWCGVSGMPRIGIEWSQQRSNGSYLNELESFEVLVPQLFRCCIYSILDSLVGNHQIPKSYSYQHEYKTKARIKATVCIFVIRS